MFATLLNTPGATADPAAGGLSASSGGARAAQVASAGERRERLEN